MIEREVERISPSGIKGARRELAAHFLLGHARRLRSAHSLVARVVVAVLLASAALVVAAGVLYVSRDPQGRDIAAAFRHAFSLGAVSLAISLRTSPARSWPTPIVHFGLVLALVTAIAASNMPS